LFVKPWDEKSKRIMDQIVKNGKAYTKDITVSRAFGRYYPELIDNDFLDIGRIDKKRETMFVTRPNVIVVPVSLPTSRKSKMKYKFHKIF